MSVSYVMYFAKYQEKKTGTPLVSGWNDHTDRKYLEPSDYEDWNPVLYQ
jgi:hypothetical protein